MSLKMKSTDLSESSINFDTCPEISLEYGEENYKTMACIKVLLFIFNMLFLATGVLLICSVFSVMDIYTEYAHFMQNQTITPTTMLILIGSIVIIIAFMGTMGVAKESVCMITVFSLMLGLVFLFEITIALTGFLYQIEIRSVLADSLSKAMQMYETDNVAMSAIDTLQTKLSCCGVENANDWTHILNTTSTALTTSMTQYNVANDSLANETTTQLFNQSISPIISELVGDYYSQYPGSCCAHVYLNNTKECASIRQVGCLDKLHLILKQSSTVLIITVITVAFIQFLGILFACSLGKLLRIQKTEREKLKWEFRNHLLQGRTGTNFETFVQNIDTDHKL